MLCAVIVVAGLDLLTVLLWVRERRRRKAAGDAHDWDAEVAAQENARLAAAVESCRLRAGEAVRERDKALASLADARRELETARQAEGVREGDLTQRNRSLRDCLTAQGLAAGEAVGLLEAALVAARKINRPGPES